MVAGARRLATGGRARPAPRVGVLLVLVLLAAAPLPAAEEEAAPSPAAVHAAVRRGAGWLGATFAGGFPPSTWHDPVELVVLTLAHAGADNSDPVYAKGLAIVETAPLEYTYRVALTAMALGHVNPRLYRARLAHCAQWLVDTQLKRGEWGYPGSGHGIDRQPSPVTVDPPLAAAQGGEPPSGPIAIERRRTLEAYGDLHGDFSNTQFAVLGLRACRDAEIEIPKATWQAALGYLEATQRVDGGWGYVYAGQPDEASYASLTAAALCSAAIASHALGKDPSRQPVVVKGLAWLAKHFEAARNVGIDRSTIIGPSSWQYYHLYSVERMGRVLAVERLGDRAWYRDGARQVLASQQGDGRWSDPAGGARRPRYLDVADTCFAILFLSLSTPPLTGR